MSFYKLMRRTKLRGWNNKLEHYPVEHLPFKLTQSLDYKFAQEVYKLSLDRSGYGGALVQSVCREWVHLMEQISILDLPDRVPLVKKIPWLNRLNLPQPETAVLKFVKELYPRFSWLPTSVKVNVKKEDRSVALDYIRPYGISSALDPKLFLHALEGVLNTIQASHHRNCEVKSFDEFTQGMNRQSSSGYPLFKKKGSEDAIVNCANIITGILSGEKDVVDEFFRYPTVVFHRFSPKVKTSLKKVIVKCRAVFGYPMHIIGISEMFFGKIIDAILKGNPYGGSEYHSRSRHLKFPFVLGLTRPELSDEVRFLRDHAARHGSILVSLDIQQMDRRLCWAWQVLTHAIVHACIDRVGGHKTDLDRSLVEQIRLAIVAYEVHGPVIGSWGTTILNNGGTKSGTRWNTLTNSITLLLASFLFTGGRGKLAGVEIVRGLSDDQVKLVQVREPSDAKCQHEAVNAIKYWYGLMGLHIHPDKLQVASWFDPIDLMGFTWDMQNRPTRPIEWVIQKLAYPEKFRGQSFDERYVVRSASILFQIYDGFELFKKLVVRKIGWLAACIRDKRDPTLTIYHAREGPQIETRLPLSNLVRYGWRLF